MVFPNFPSSILDKITKIFLSRLSENSISFSEFLQFLLVVNFRNNFFLIFRKILIGFSEFSKMLLLVKLKKFSCFSEVIAKNWWNFLSKIFYSFLKKFFHRSNFLGRKINFQWSYLLKFHQRTIYSKKMDCLQINKLQVIVDVWRTLRLPKIAFAGASLSN